MCRAHLNFKMSFWQCQQFCARHERFSSRDTTAFYRKYNRLWSCGLLLLFFNHAFFTTSLSTSVSPQVIGLISSQHLLVQACKVYDIVCFGEPIGWSRKGLGSQRSRFITANYGKPLRENRKTPKWIISGPWFIITTTLKIQHPWLSKLSVARLWMPNCQLHLHGLDSIGENDFVTGTSWLLHVH